MNDLKHSRGLAAILLLFAVMLAAAGSLADDTVFAAPGDTGENAAEMLRLASEMRYVRNLNKNETKYRERYKSGVVRMETAFGLQADGVITVTEMEEMRQVLYPSCALDAAAVLERLCDLGYMSKKLPDDHKIYDLRYEPYVKAAERGLGLTADGCLTAREQAVILSQTVQKPDPVNQVSAKGYKGYVRLSWQTVPGALWYEIYRDDELIASVTSVNYRDENVKMDGSYYYSVKACRYTASSDISYRFPVHVEIAYTTMNLQQLNSEPESKTGKFVRVTGLRKENEAFFDGKDLYQLAGNGKAHVWLLIRNYNMQVWPGDGVGLYENEKVTSITAAGEVTGVKDSSCGSVPVIRTVEVRFSVSK